MSFQLRIKRIYESADVDDGYRILVDRLWPRGLSKARASFDLWAKDVSPSPQVRKAFAHQSGAFAEFCRNYRDELEHNAEATRLVELCREKLRLGNVTLLYAASNPEENNAVVLLVWIENRAKEE